MYPDVNSTRMPGWRLASCSPTKAVHHDVRHEWVDFVGARKLRGSSSKSMTHGRQERQPDNFAQPPVRWTAIVAPA
jgi:hypothetical protein